jgi:hypothetical protein
MSCTIICFEIALVMTICLFVFNYLQMNSSNDDSSEELDMCYMFVTVIPKTPRHLFYFGMY